MELELMPTNVPPMGHWEIDPLHSHISFSVRHMLVSIVSGSFKTFVAVADLPEDPARALVHVSIDASSVDTRVPERDEHLRSEEFLDTTRHSQITFDSKEVFSTAAGWRLHGDLTMCGITRPVDFDLEVRGVVDAGSELRAGLHAGARIDRHEFGVGPAGGGLQGSALLADTVAVSVDAQAVRRLDDVSNFPGGVR